MRIDLIPAGDNPPDSLNVLIEVPIGGEPVKYEFDKASGALFVDRFLHTPMRYPANYGFIPHTLGDDGDPLDIIVVGQVPVVPASVISCRPIGVLVMTDEKGGDEKILAVPADDLYPFYRGVRTYTDLPAILYEQVAHFFAHYKDLEQGKWVTVAKWEGPARAEELIVQAIDRYPD